MQGLISWQNYSAPFKATNISSRAFRRFQTATGVVMEVMKALLTVSIEKVSVEDFDIIYTLEQFPSNFLYTF